MKKPCECRTYEVSSLNEEAKACQVGENTVYLRTVQCMFCANPPYPANENGDRIINQQLGYIFRPLILFCELLDDGKILNKKCWYTTAVRR